MAPPGCAHPAQPCTASAAPDRTISTPADDRWREVEHADRVFTPALTDMATRIATLLRARGETVAVAEGSAGGLISATLLSVPGASAYYIGGAIVYTAAAGRALMAGPIEVPRGLRGATEEFARYLAQSAAAQMAATWGIGEAGAAGPANPYGDPAGHAWVAVSGPSDATRHILTGLDGRTDNMIAFAIAALTLLVDTLESPARP